MCHDQAHMSVRKLYDHASHSDEAIVVLEKARLDSMAIGQAYLFPMNGKAMTKQKAAKLFGEIAELSGKITEGQRFGWDSLRRKLASDLDASGASLKTIKDLGGWKKIDTVLLYIKSDENAQREALKQRKTASIRGHWTPRMDTLNG